MRILTWNVNVLRTCLDYHPFSSMKKRNIEGLLDELGAEIFCFQEHKTRRPQLEKSMACPGPYDAFWTFPRSKTGYSGVCTYVDSRYCVPLKAEEGITGLLLGDAAGSTMKPPWTEDERIGHYPDVEAVDWEDELGGGMFDPRKLDMEGRAVVCDFGLFVLFNLYCPNETNETRRPYKMNFLKALQTRVKLLMQAGREVIIVGDINIMRAPIDSGEGGIKTSAEQHYEHPARRILDDWCAPKGYMVDVVRESWPEREDMFTCWNQKLDARSANYGSRIDLILCTPGLRPWIKGGDIETKVYGSDHCPVHIDLHESITTPSGETLVLRDMLNPANRRPTTAAVYPTEPPRTAPEPPRFATKFLEEFSGRQTTLRSFFGGGQRKNSNLVSLSPERSLSATPVEEKQNGDLVPMIESDKIPVRERTPSPILRPAPSPSTPFGMARAAFDAIDAPRVSSSTPPLNAEASSSKRRSPPIDMTKAEEDEQRINGIKATPKPNPKTKSSSTASTTRAKPLKPISGQTKLSAFFAQPPSKAKRKQSPVRSPSLSKREQSIGTPTQDEQSYCDIYIPSQDDPPPTRSSPSPTKGNMMNGNGDEETLIAQAIAEADQNREDERAAKNARAAPKWNELFAKKLPPLCTVHQKPCKDFIVKIPGPNKGKRFWLCSLPVGAGYDTGRTKRPRQDVNPNFRCDFFLWDSANSRKEVPKSDGEPVKKE